MQNWQNYLTAYDVSPVNSQPGEIGSTTTGTAIDCTAEIGHGTLPGATATAATTAAAIASIAQAASS